MRRHGRRMDRTGDRARDDDFALRCCHSWIRYPGGRTMKAIILGILLGLALPAAAERAASIDYEFVPRPAGLPTEYDGPGLRFLAITAIDGARVDAALWQPPNAKTLVLMVHGSGETYHGNPNGFLGKGLAERGYAVLAINTRQSGPRVNTDNFMDVRRDLEAAFYTARALGYKSIVLHGHSLGNIQVQYYAANNWQPEIKAVVLTGMFGNLPWKSRHILVQDEQNWPALFGAAMTQLREGKAAEVMPVQMSWITGQKVPMTAQHFLTYRWENSSAADGTYWIRRVPYPILMVRDDGDAIVQPFEPYMLLSAASTSGSLVPGIEYVKLPNKERGPAEHGFIHNRRQLIETVVGWLKEQNL
ncbi:MAG: alpha/beta fold hydrolase [Betaproteobacteria bacterium]|nr:MAG: alpha/beta fold hydrolase [Betaproteobacteria bacterium]